MPQRALLTSLILVVALADSRSPRHHGGGDAAPAASRRGAPPAQAVQASPPPASASSGGGACWECAVSAAFFVAGLVQGIAGFGAGIVAMSIAPLSLPLTEASPIVAVFTVAVSAALAVQLRDSLGSASVRGTVASLLAGCFIGVPLGGYLLTYADPRWLRLVLGACMLLFAAERLMHDDGGAAAERSAYAAVAAADGVGGVAMVPLRPAQSDEGAGPGAAAPSPVSSAAPRRRFVDHPAVAPSIGVVSGLLGGALNEAGPPVVVFLALKGWGKDDTKAALQMYFTLVSLGVVAMMAARGILQARHLYYDAVATPAAALGLTVGVLLYNRIDQHVFSRILVGGMLLGGVSYVAHSAAALLSEEAPAGVLRWLMQLYVGTVQEADAPQ